MPRYQRSITVISFDKAAARVRQLPSWAHDCCHGGDSETNEDFRVFEATPFGVEPWPTATDFSRVWLLMKAAFTFRRGIG